MKYIKSLIVLIILLAASGCSVVSSDSVATTQSTNNLTTQENKVVLAKTEANLVKAKTAAANWKNDAQFYAYNFNVPASLSPTDLTETFVFGSTSEPDNWWTYSIDSNGKAVRALVPKDDFLGRDLQMINETYLKVGYSEALKTADENGGLVYKSKYPNFSETLTMTEGAPNNWLWYVIEFKSAEGTEKIRISANDGKIYNDQGQTE
jgi:hypothetical protein